MEDAAFNRLKGLYRPVFWKDSTDSLIAKAQERLRFHHVKEPVRERIRDFILQYGFFGFTKQENISGDALTFYFHPGYHPYYREFQERAAFIGGYRNCSCSLYARDTYYIESFYADSAGVIWNQDHRLIAENITDFWEYVIEKEYDYHPEITCETVNKLRRAGWYEGRRINIDALLEECMADDVFPSDIQIAFMEEFGGLCGDGDDVDAFWFSDKRESWCFANLAKLAEETVFSEERWVLETYGADTLQVGYCAGEYPVYLTAYGQLITRQRSVGRNLWEGIQCVTGY